MGDFWKPTADMFSKLFEKPKMAEKLLIKPPFKYLFDIIMETTKVTEYAKGLYVADELNPDFYDTKEKKMAFLQKAIDLVQMMAKKQLAAKPAKIVAGMEPEHTNEFLQEMYQMATSGKSSEPYVKKLLGGGKEQKPAPPPPAKEKPAPPPAEEKPVPSQKTVEAKKPQKPAEQPAPPAPAPPAEEKKPIVRPPSAPRRNNPQQQQQQPPTRNAPPPQLQEEQDDVAPVQSSKEIKKPNKPIEAANYSKNIQETLNQANEQNQQQPEEARVDDGGPKLTMGNLRGKKKTSKTGQAGGIIAAGGELTEKELELVKSMIQTMCQNCAPIGKSIEFINDDIESMNQELLAWRKQYNASKAKMQNQMKVTEEALVPMYNKLAEIDEQIKDQKAKIQNAKAQIIKNQSTISTLLYSVVTTKN